MVRDFESKFRVISELQRLGERAFVFKLRKKRPDISPAEISAEIARWYLTREDVSSEDGLVRRADLSEFNTVKN